MSKGFLLYQNEMLQNIFLDIWAFLDDPPLFHQHILLADFEHENGAL